jgi:competence protein ComEC
LLVHGGLRGVDADRWFAQWTRTQWIMFVGLSPVVLAWFQEVSLIGPIANAFAVPVVSLAVVPLSLAGAVLPWDVPLEVAAWLLQHLHDALGWLASLSWATYVQAAPSAVAVTFAMLGAAWLLMPAGTPSRWLGALALLPLLLGRPAGPAHGEAWVTLLDVGQGLAAVVRTERETLLFDSGPAWSADADAGSRTVVPYLRGEGIRRLSAMVISHDDRDHTGGAASILRAVPVDLVLTPLPRAHRALSGARRVMGCVAGQTWDWSGVRFEMLHPLEKDSVRPPARDNARSCVLRVTAGTGSVLLTADVERAGESAMVAAGEDLHADILVAPHHGSKTSSSEPFIDAVSPREVWFPVGYRNRFGHPHEDVVSRYRSRGVGLRRTDDAGALTVRLGRSEIAVREWRREHRRYWHPHLPPNPLPSP